MNRTNHRTWLKVILNPILRKFGFQIVSCFSEQDNKFLRYEVRKVMTETKQKKTNNNIEKKEEINFDWELNPAQKVYITEEQEKEFEKNNE